MILDNLLIYMQQNAQQATPIFPTGIIVGVPRCRYSIITVRLDWPANIIRTLNKEELIMGRKATAPVVDDVLTDEDIEAAAAAADAGESANEADVESAVAEVETDEAVASANAATTPDEPASDKATPKAPPAPRMSLDTHTASDIITTRLGSDHAPEFDLIEGRWKKPTAKNLRACQIATLALIDALDKKAREKAINLFVSVNKEKAPSVYTRMAVSLLESEGQFTQKSLTDHFLAAGYMIGTARRSPVSESIRTAPN